MDINLQKMKIHELKKMLLFMVLLEVIIIDREAREIMYLVASVCSFGCLSVCALTAEQFDLRP